MKLRRKLSATEQSSRITRSLEKKTDTKDQSEEDGGQRGRGQTKEREQRSSTKLDKNDSSSRDKSKSSNETSSLAKLDRSKANILQSFIQKRISRAKKKVVNPASSLQRDGDENTKMNLPHNTNGFVKLSGMNSKEASRLLPTTSVVLSDVSPKSDKSKTKKAKVLPNTSGKMELLTSSNPARISRSKQLKGKLFSAQSRLNKARVIEGISSDSNTSSRSSSYQESRSSSTTRNSSLIVSGSASSSNIASRSVSPSSKVQQRNSGRSLRHNRPKQGTYRPQRVLSDESDDGNSESDDTSVQQQSPGRRFGCRMSGRTKKNTMSSHLRYSFRPCLSNPISDNSSDEAQQSDSSYISNISDVKSRTLTKKPTSKIEATNKSPNDTILKKTKNVTVKDTNSSVATKGKEKSSKSKNAPLNEIIQMDDSSVHPSNEPPVKKRRPAANSKKAPRNLPNISGGHQLPAETELQTFSTETAKAEEDIPPPDDMKDKVVLKKKKKKSQLSAVKVSVQTARKTVVMSSSVRSSGRVQGKKSSVVAAARKMKRKCALIANELSKNVLKNEMDMSESNSDQIPVEMNKAEAAVVVAVPKTCTKRPSIKSKSSVSRKKALTKEDGTLPEESIENEKGDSQKPIKDSKSVKSPENLAESCAESIEVNEDQPNGGDSKNGVAEDLPEAAKTTFGAPRQRPKKNVSGKLVRRKSVTKSKETTAADPIAEKTRTLSDAADKASKKSMSKRRSFSADSECKTTKKPRLSLDENLKLTPAHDTMNPEKSKDSSLAKAPETSPSLANGDDNVPGSSTTTTIKKKVAKKNLKTNIFRNVPAAKLPLGLKRGRGSMAMPEFVCRECGLQFDSLESFKEHDRNDCANIVYGMGLMVDDQLHECPHCHLTFVYKSTQKKHANSCRNRKNKKSISKCSNLQVADSSPPISPPPTSLKAKKTFTSRVRKILNPISSPIDSENLKQIPGKKLNSAKKRPSDSAEVSSEKKGKFSDTDDNEMFVKPRKVNPAKRKLTKDSSDGEEMPAPPKKATTSRRKVVSRKVNAKSNVSETEEEKPVTSSMEETPVTSSVEEKPRTSSELTKTIMTQTKQVVSEPSEEKTSDPGAQSDLTHTNSTLPVSSDLKSNELKPTKQTDGRDSIGSPNNKDGSKDVAAGVEYGKNLPLPVPSQVIKDDSSSMSTDSKDKCSSLIPVNLSASSSVNIMEKTNSVLQSSSMMPSTSGVSPLPHSPEVVTALADLGMMLQERCTSEPSTVEVTAFMLQYRLSPNQAREILHLGKQYIAGKACDSTTTTTDNNSVETNNLEESDSAVDNPTEIDSKKVDGTEIDDKKINHTEIDSKKKVARSVVLRLPQVPAAEESLPCVVPGGASTWCAVLQELVNQSHLHHLHMLLLTTARIQKDAERLQTEGGDTTQHRCLGLSWSREELLKSVSVIEDIIKQIVNVKTELARQKMLLAMKKTFEAAAL